MIDANFIPPARVQRARLRKLIRRWGILFACYGVLLLVMLPIGRVAMALPTSEDLAVRLRARQREDVANAEGAKLHARIDRLARAIDAAETAGNHPGIARLLGAVARCRGDNAMYTRIALAITQVVPSAPSATTPQSKDPKPNVDTRSRQQLKLLLSGSASAPAKVYELAQRLEALGVFSSVTITQTRANTAANEGATAFELEAVSNETEESLR